MRAFVLLALAGCSLTNQPYLFDDSDGSVPCPPGTHRCVPTPGAPWDGPFALTAGTSTCGGDFPEPGVELFSDLRLPDASCDCICGPVSTTCPRSAASADFLTAGDCNDASGTTTQTLGTCGGPPFGISLMRLNINTSCASGSVNASIPPTSWGATTRACAARGVLRCAGGGACAPIPAAPFEAGRLCVVAPGDLACPDGFPARSLHHTGVNDARACPTTCSCTSTGARCAADVLFYQGASCTTTPLACRQSISSDRLTCITCRSDLAAVQEIAKDDGVCVPEELSVSGTAAANGPRTVCCTT
jgi:hypothetical protein